LIPDDILLPVLAAWLHNTAILSCGNLFTVLRADSDFTQFLISKAFLMFTDMKMINDLVAFLSFDDVEAAK